ncbi:phage terminase large subunit [Candidatus Pacearchaeota archaeon]|nr:phage terminase large subunit [Candidatus Pacearchaeota archaeon]
MGSNYVWVPQPGSQQRFLSCPAFEVLFDGTRGNGKTDALLMDFVQHVNQGFGVAWRGVLFRRTYPELGDIIAKSKKWFPQLFPTAFYNETKHEWHFPNGEVLLFRQFERPSDYWKFHGHEYTWIGWEELTTWATSEGYEAMKSCCRSSTPGVPKKYRSTTNPWGVGHNWVKRRFVDPGVEFIQDKDGDRVRIRGDITENQALLKADPQYIKQLDSIKDAAKRKAWRHGNWNIVSGGALDGYWFPDQQVLKPFEIPFSWKIGRSFDWGSSHPFSVGWWATSDGTEVNRRCFPAGSIFRIAELYGWNGEPNKGLNWTGYRIAEEIKKAESALKISSKINLSDSIADNSIFNSERGGSIADDMQRAGVGWSKGNKSPGSRKLGLDKMRALLDNSAKPNHDKPGLYIFETCTQFIRTIPVLQMDSKKLEDVDTNGEDHIYDESRYYLLRPDNRITKGKINGL